MINTKTVIETKFKDTRVPTFNSLHKQTKQTVCFLNYACLYYGRTPQGSTDCSSKQ